MDIADLGELTGDVLLFGGPYSNAQATRALLARASGMAPANVICTGDIVAYCADPLDTIAMIRGHGMTVVAGNTEKQLAAGAEDCGCGFEAGSFCDRLSAGWYAFAGASVTDPDRAWLGARPDIAVFRHARRRYAVIHGGVSDIARFLWPVSPEAAFREEIALIEAQTGPVDQVIAGHSGLAFQRQIGARLWTNAGVIGLPPHDGRPMTRYAVLSADGIRFHRLAYDHKAARDAMQAAGLTQGYDQSLSSGIWPSEDVLPPELRRH